MAKATRQWLLAAVATAAVLVTARGVTAPKPDSAVTAAQSAAVQHGAGDEGGAADPDG